MLVSSQCDLKWVWKSCIESGMQVRLRDLKGYRCQPWLSISYSYLVLIKRIQPLTKVVTLRLLLDCQSAVQTYLSTCFFSILLMIIGWRTTS